MLHRLSIRWRLAVISAALTFAILTLFALVVGQLTTSRMRDDFNNQMAAAVDELRDRLRVGVEENHLVVRTGLNTYAASTGAVIRVLNASTGQVVAQTPKAPDLGPVALSDGRGSGQVGGFRVESRRTVLRPSPLNGVGFSPLAVIVQYARPVSVVEDSVKSVRFFLLGGVLAGTVLALIGGLVLARRSLAPIARLTAMARSISRTRDPAASVPVPDAEDEVAELARTLDEMLVALTQSREETQQMLDRQRQFVADASHELRTPLTSVLANLELLADVLDGEEGEAACSALRSSKRMKRLVADLLLLARADAAREAPHAPTDLGQVLLEAVAEAGPLAGDHVVSVDTERVVVDGARDDLHRVALNLIENALKHTPPGSTVHASVGARGGRALLVVEDDGPGVPRELRERIFERFVRGEGDRGGSFGLGLSIVRAVAEGHGGSVRLEDRAGGGTRFVVDLPAVAQAVPVAVPAAAPA
ncbi:HAMP domain-containing sensor histidine kinase [Conexibacter sp. SYSU D00693]|uniref:sensor histidine kinase n=1 Tax=Conexibacter sp. SYSU D00693 TaxID=2812560 RepID=UPI00196A43AC|nr:HAMP domain-containing sensor histidine kinase [Conexibacter sp. SYSU D00693]